MTAKLNDSEVTESIKKYIAELCGIAPDQINTSSALVEFGIDSLKVLYLVKFIEASFGYRIPLPVLFDSPNIDLIAAAVCRDSGQNR